MLDLRSDKPCSEIHRRTTPSPLYPKWLFSPQNDLHCLSGSSLFSLHWRFLSLPVVTPNPSSFFCVFFPIPKQVEDISNGIGNQKSSVNMWSSAGDRAIIIVLSWWLSKWMARPAAALPLPGDRLDTRTLGRSPGLIRSSGVLPNRLCFNKPSSDSDACWHLRSFALS